MFKTACLDRQFRPLMLLLAISSAFATSSAFAFNSGSTGADGALAPTVNTTIDLPASGILNYTSINIPAGVTVRFRRNALNTPVYLLVSGDVTIAGAIDVSGTDAAHAGTAGDGNLADDGVPGLGGPGGFDGGRGGLADSALTPAIIRGGAGLGPGGGKGGIEGPDNTCNNNPGRRYNSIGGGAGYSTDGVSADDAACGAGRVSAAVGRAYGSAILQPLIGGSGGGGGRGGANFAGSGGGGGGGAILLASSGTINITGSVLAEGGGSGVSSGTGGGASGAGGSGGAIRIMATAFSGAGRLSTVGACINSTGTAQSQNYSSSVWTPTNYGSSPRWFGCSAHKSSMGRIRVEAETVTYSGQSFPAYVADQPGPIFLSSLPALRIASVAGTAVPPNPTGNADVVLPADVVNPVTVTFETTNVPTGNTVLFKMIPAYGEPVEVISPAISGSAASGTTSVQVNLPQGPSTLQATTTYTVVVAMGEVLSRYAQNELVEKVQIIATLGGSENQAKLITVSGKEYLVPMAVLQTVGFTG